MLTSRLEQDCALLLESTVEPGVKLGQQWSRRQLQLLIPDVASPGCAIIQANLRQRETCSDTVRLQSVASKEEMLLLEGADSHTKVKLPPAMQATLDASIAALELTEYNPLDFEVRIIFPAIS